MLQPLHERARSYLLGELPCEPYPVGEDMFKPTTRVCSQITSWRGDNSARLFQKYIRLPVWFVGVNEMIQALLLNEGIAMPILVPLAREVALPRLFVQSI